MQERFGGSIRGGQEPTLISNPHNDIIDTPTITGFCFLPLYRYRSHTAACNITECMAAGYCVLHHHPHDFIMMYSNLKSQSVPPTSNQSPLQTNKKRGIKYKRNVPRLGNKATRDKLLQTLTGPKSTSINPGNV